MTAWRLAGWPTSCSPLVGEGDDRRRGARAFGILDDLRRGAFHHGDAGVGRAEVDTDDLSHYVSLLFGRAVRTLEEASAETGAPEIPGQPPLKRTPGPSRADGGPGDSARIRRCGRPQGSEGLSLRRFGRAPRLREIRAGVDRRRLPQVDLRPMDKAPLPEGRPPCIDGRFDRAEQEALVAAIRDVVAAAPLLPAGNAEDRQAVLGADDELRPARLGLGPRRLSLPAAGSADRPALAADPHSCCALWDEVAGFPLPPEEYLPGQFLRRRRGARPASRRRTRQELDRARRLGLARRQLPVQPRRRPRAANEPTRSFRLSSGDVLVFGGQSRLVFHGVDRIHPGTSTLLPRGGRINLTLRRVTPRS